LNSGQLPSNLAVTGFGGFVQSIILTVGSDFSAASWTFTAWDDAADFILLTGAPGTNVITGSSQSDTITSSGGGDTLDGRGGGDFYEFAGESLSGLTLNDTGASGTDTLFIQQPAAIVDFSAATIGGIEALRILGTTANAIFNASQFSALGVATNLAVTGGTAAQTVTVQNAGSFTAAAWTFTNWEAANDVIAITGTAAGNTITGSSQNDTMTGGAGNDSLEGGGGSDTAIFAGASTSYTLRRTDTGSWAVADTDEGTNGNDGTDTVGGVERLSFLADATIVTVANLIGAFSDTDGGANGVAEDAANGATVGITALAVDGNGDGISYSLTDDAGGRFEIDAGGVVKVLDASLIDFELAASHNITARATSADGSFTEQQLSIGIGFIPLNGTADPNVLNGTDKIDIITGFAGKDIMTGGGSADDFNFDVRTDSRKGGTRNVITDFLHGSDDIDLAGIDARSGAGNQAFKWIGGAKFHHSKGELHFIRQNVAGTANDKTIVEGDINGDGRADFQIELTGLVALNKLDFIL